MKSNYLKIFIAIIVAFLFTSLSVQAANIDEEIVSSAQNSYVFKKYLKDDNITITSREGDVVLKGTVVEETNKLLAKETVANLPGVNSVDNQLTLKGPDEESDSWISMQVKYLLFYNRNVSGMKTKVFVTNGIVTLKGEAGNQAQKDLAGEYAKDVKGVKDVRNEMTIAKVSGEMKKTMGEKIDDASITAQVKMALLTHHSTSAFKTGVTTKNGVVTLSGKSSSAAGKDMVGKVTKDVNGVVSVINDMTITN